MKKEPASSDFSSRLDVIVSKLSSFEAILVEVIICLIIFISVLTPKVAQASTPGRASLSVRWDRPGYAKVTSTYTNGTDTGFKCSGLTSCTIGPFWGTPTINYVVKDVSTGYPIKDGSIRTFANSVGQGFATISWNWTYELQVYPFAFGSCTAAGPECRRKTYSDNSASFNETYGDLLPNTTYQNIVCLTACTYYAPQLKRYTEVTGFPATALAVSNYSANCNAYGLVNADFTWNRATGRNYDLQYLDKSTDAAWPNGVNVPFGANPNKLSVTDLFPNQAYRFRVNSRIAGTNLWDTSYTAYFTVPSCTVSNRLVTAKAVLVSPIATNPTGMVCSTTSGVVVNFKWQAATISGGTYDYAYIDYSVYNDNFVLPYKNSPLAPSATIFGGSGFSGGTNYYWRVNYHVANSSPAQWVTSDVGQFKTPDCSASLPLVTAKAVLNNPPLMSCTGSSPVNVSFSWKAATISGGSYDYIYIDYSVYNDNFVLPYKNSVLAPSATLFGASGFASGVTYYWRINAHVANSSPAQWVRSDVLPFKAMNCAVSGTTGVPSPLFRPTDLGTRASWANVVPAGSAHWQAVGEVTADEDTSYVSSTVDGKVDSYKHNPSGIAAGTPILGVRVSVRAKYVTPGTNNMVAPAIVSSGVLKWADRTITGSYADYSNTWSVDPATNLPWTIAGVDNLEIGVRKSYAGADVRVTQVWAQVIYNGGPLLAAMSCSRADLNNDGSVSILDVAMISANFTPTKVYNPKYDMNSDGIVNYSDANLASNYFGKNCFARTGTVNTVCTAIAPGSIVDVTFNWAPANGDPGIKTQWLDFDTSDHGMGGGWPAGKQFEPGVKTWATHAFPQGTTYFWRINTQYADGSWKSSKTPSTFTTRDCTPVPSNLVATPATTEKLADGTPCASAPYSVLFKWDNPNKGVGWYIDVTSAVFSPGGFSNKSVDGTTSLLTTGSDLNVPLQFKPGITYRWGIFNAVKRYEGNPFSIQPCAQSSTELDYYIRMKETSILPADPTAINNKIAAHPSIQLDLMDNTYYGESYKCESYATCWDFLMQESIKNGVSPAWSLAVLYTEGAAMGFVSNSGATPCSARDFVCYVHAFINSVNGRYPTAENSYFKVYNPGNEYQSYYDWVDVFCGANAPSLCEGDAGSLFQYRVKPNYQFIAPGKLIQL